MPYTHAFNDVKGLGHPVGSGTLEIIFRAIKKHTHVQDISPSLFEVFKGPRKCIIWSVTNSFENQGDSSQLLEVFRFEFVEFELIRDYQPRRGNKDDDGLLVLGQPQRLLCEINI